MSSKIRWTPEVVPNGGIDETRAPTQIADNAWTAATNVEPLPDGVRTRQGTSKSNTTALQKIAESFEGGTDTRSFVDGTSEYIAQSFQSATQLSVNKFAVRLKITAGAPTGDIDAAIHTNNAGVPNASSVTGASFADVTGITASTITSEYKWYFFTLAAPVTLNAATTYHIIVFHFGAVAGNTFGIEEVTTPSGYANGQLNFATALGAWTTVAAADMNFRIYSGSGAITGITDYWLSDGVTQRHLVLHDQELYKNVGGTMTPVSTRSRTGYTASANTFPSFTTANDRLMIAHDSDTPSKFYVLSGVEYWENQGIAPPTATPTPSAVAGGSLPDETYQIDYQYWNNDLAIPSNFRYQGVATISQATSGGNNTIRLTGLPSTVAREGDRATHLRIYLKNSTETVFTFAGSGANQGQVALGTTTHDITTRQTAIQAEYDHVVPPTHSINAAAENRQFFAGDPSFPWRVWFSFISGTTAYYESVPVTAFRDFGKGDGDYVTALKFVPPSSVLVGMKNSIWLLDARYPGTSDRQQIARGIGIAHHNAAIVVGRTVYFVSDADRSKGMFVWRGSGEPLPVLGLDDTFKSLNQARLRYASCAHYAPGDNRFQWWTLLTSSAQSAPDRILLYDYFLNAWTVYNISGNVLGMVDISSVTRIFIGGTADGFERQADSGTQDDTTDIATTLTFKAHDFGSQEILKRMRWVDYVAAAKAQGSINLSIIYDFGARPPSTSATLNHIANTGTTWTWGTSIWGGGHVWGSASQNIAGRHSVNGFGKVVQPAINASKPFHLKSIAWAAQPTGRR